MFSSESNQELLIAFGSYVSYKFLLGPEYQRRRMEFVALTSLLSQSKTLMEK